MREINDYEEARESWYGMIKDEPPADDIRDEKLQERADAEKLWNAINTGSVRVVTRILRPLK